jgi:hypothetical protein
MSSFLGTVVARDGTGKEYVIEVRVRGLTPPMRRTGDKSGPVLSLFDLRTVGGEPINYVGKGRYQLVTTGGLIDLTSDDPDAP